MLCRSKNHQKQKSKPKQTKNCCPTSKIVSPIFWEGDRKDTEQKRVARFVKYMLSSFMEISH